MFLCVIRGDLRNPLYISDVEPRSQADAPVESPRGQTYYVSRPNLVAIQKYLTDQGLSELLRSTGWGGTGASSWTGAYNSFTHNATTTDSTPLTNTLAGVNLQVYTLTITVTGRTAGTITATFGGVAGSAISITTTTTVTATGTGTLSIVPTTNFDGTITVSIKVAAAAALLAATVPSYAGGVVIPTVNISGTAIKAIIGLTGATNTQVSALQNMLGYHFVETDILKKSFLAGVIHGLRSPKFNPDPRGDLNHAPTTPGPAVVCVNDVVPGSTTTTLFAILQPVITGLTLSGTLTVTGATGGLAGYGLYESTVIITGKGARRITQAQILAAGGTVSDTSIVIPAALIAATATVPTIPTAGSTFVRVQTNDMLSNTFAL